MEFEETVGTEWEEQGEKSSASRDKISAGIFIANGLPSNEMVHKQYAICLNSIQHFFEVGENLDSADFIKLQDGLAYGGSGNDESYFNLQLSSLRQ